MLAGSAQDAEVTANDLSDLFFSCEPIHCEIMHGDDSRGSCKFNRKEERMAITVPLVRCCAMLRLRVGRS
jgi:hypothetical protein